MKKIMFNDSFGLTEAVINGHKTETRQICKEQHWSFSDLVNANENESFIFERPKYQKGEIIAIAQSYKDVGLNPEIPLMEASGVGGYVRTEFAPGWTNKMFVRADLMPYKIRITRVTVERLQEIDNERSFNEGLISFSDLRNRYFGFYDFTEKKYYWYTSYRQAFAYLIDRICGNGTWESNPYVFAYEFELLKNKI